MAGLSNPGAVYAPASDLVVYVYGEGSTTEIPNVDRLLIAASQAVRQATISAVYNADEHGTPYDVRLRDALHDATILQAAALLAVGWTPGASVATEPKAVASKSQGGTSVSFEAGGGAQGEARRALIAGALDPSARRVLDEAGLIVNTVAPVGVGQRPFMRHYPWPYQIDAGEG